MPHPDVVAFGAAVSACAKAWQKHTFRSCITTQSGSIKQSPEVSGDGHQMKQLLQPKQALFESECLTV